MTQSRYARQMVLAEVGAEGQKKLAAGRVLIVGAGGLGAPAAMYLAAAGVGSIGLVDADQVDVSNLQRQIIYDNADQGRDKVTRAAARLQAMNPEVHVAAYPTRLTAANAVEIAAPYDIILDGSDNFSTKFLLNDLAYKLGKPLVYGTILRWEGQASVFWAPHGPCYRCLFPEPPQTYVPNCAEAGVIGAMGGIIGSVQALETVKLLLNGSQGPQKDGLEPLVGQLFHLRAHTMETRRLALKKNPDCPCCSKSPADIVLRDLDNACDANAAKDVPNYAAAELAVGDRWRDFIPLDIRESQEWLRGHLPAAHHWPLSKLQEGLLPELPTRSKPVLVYCQSGIRSQRALQILRAAGWQNLAHLSDGFGAWRGPVVFT
ncbi:ThiF family adenylyltransferase [Oligoflexus tunisiensis]|uniref:ThiF family adenylyltransferase n=1 Tax=Oligoflexus tunisiensis TaxID=708132 RepID=UPI000A92CF91|nr:ThiF family adenylyltransferase [Oligoflexus tunisiensis]